MKKIFIATALFLTTGLLTNAKTDLRSTANQAIVKDKKELGNGDAKLALIDKKELGNGDDKKELGNGDDKKELGNGDVKLA